MKQIFMQKGSAVVKDVSPPLLNESFVLVRVHHSFISSGTEGATLTSSSHSLLQKVLRNPIRSGYKFLGAVSENGFKGTMALIQGRQLGEISSIGYSCAGKVIAIGKNITKYRVGDYVACAGAGIANHADIVAVPENLLALVANKDNLKQTSITTIGSIALQGIRRADLRLGEIVCIVGLGLIGQLTVQLAKLAGCKVIGVDLQEDRLKLAQKCGADYLFSPQKTDLEKEVAFITNHYGVDTTIITAASSSGGIIQQSMNITRMKGKVVLVGDVKIEFERNPFYEKEIDFLISCSYGPGRYDKSYERDGNDYPYGYVRWTEQRNMQLFVDLVERGELDINSLISKEFSLDQVQDAYESLKEKKYLGMVLSYKSNLSDVDVAKNIKLTKKVTIDLNKISHYISPASDKVNVGLIGAGGFARIKLLPILKKIKNVSIYSIVDAQEANAINVARQYSAEKSGNDYSVIVDDKNVNVVIIATPHKGHTDQALACLQKGKAVFLEKPAAINAKQLQKLKVYLHHNPQSLFCVGFNRSWAPFNRKIGNIVVNRKTPLVVHYRMNAGFISKNHWVQDPQHGGRIIGEACHIFELFCYLTDAQPVSVSVETARPKGDDLGTTDNVSTQIRFDDGSCCSLLYTALGNNLLPKERMEVFFDGKAIVMDDYVALKGYGVEFDQKVMSADKGHSALLTNFMRKAQDFDGSVPIPFERIVVATHMSIVVDELARIGGGKREL